MKLTHFVDYEKLAVGTVVLFFVFGVVTASVMVVNAMAY